jgi:hypothetical protein
MKNLEPIGILKTERNKISASVQKKHLYEYVCIFSSKIENVVWFNLMYNVQYQMQSHTVHVCTVCSVS